jgi:hypothetical protein
MIADVINIIRAKDRRQVHQNRQKILPVSLRHTKMWNVLTSHDRKGESALSQGDLIPLVRSYVTTAK